MITGARIQKATHPHLQCTWRIAPVVILFRDPPEVLTADAIKRCNQHARTAACELVGGGVAQGVKGCL
jgi:hypothetical protein